MVGAIKPGITRRGTAKDLADHDAGYAPNGESEHSRRSASSPKISLSHGKRNDGRLIRENEIKLAKIRARLLTENNPAQLVKLKRDFEIKSAFIERLKSEART
jgi:hypothetical protein